MERVIEIGRWLITLPPGLPSTDSEDWYAGLCVDPHSFSDQLCKLQNSLRPAGHPVTQQVVQQVVQQEAAE